MSCRIKPALFRTSEDKERFARFQETFDSPEKFADLIAAAHKCLNEAQVAGDRTFYEDVLEVEIAGPTLAPLTIVDLPGLIHYQRSPTAKFEIDLVTSLVKRYMRQSNSIILAIVSAHNDINNQIVLEHIKSTIPDGSRTLGIITKPDELPAGSEKEQDYINHARTNPDHFKYGWHVVRNRSYEEQAVSFEERDTNETEFFRDSNWTSLAQENIGLGVDSLRQRLSKMLLDHIALSLPAIVKRLESDLQESDDKLNKLGEARNTSKEQQDYLLDISDAFGDYTRDALSGRYHRKSFFGDAENENGRRKRLRAAIRNLNDEFARTMLQKGHRWHIIEDKDEDEPFLAKTVDHPNVIRKSEFITHHVDRLAYIERGSELPGMSNPLLIGSLFQQQSEPWQGIASTHLLKVWRVVEEFFEDLLDHLTDDTTRSQLLIHTIDPSLVERRTLLQDKLEELLRPHRDYDPISIDPSFTRKALSVREENVARRVIKNLPASLQAGVTLSSSEIKDIVSKVTLSEGKCTNQYGSFEALEFMQAYYETAILIFINNVASLAIEQCLLAGLPKIFSSATVRDMSDETIKAIASEPPSTLAERTRLRERVEILRRGIKTVRRIQPSFRKVDSMRDSLSTVQGKTFQPTANDTNPAKVVFFPPSNKQNEESPILFSFKCSSEARKKKPHFTPAGAKGRSSGGLFTEGRGLQPESRKRRNGSFSSPAAGKPGGLFGMPIDKSSGEKSS
ncbi:Nn.00g052970.m01.CDS01 [Neocucurbitaria sp. VM-36]